ncbi:MAG TPA: response regulator [Chryseosolibacter sp.]|nr:response regulator [Chryseosolibacter sp.]
MNFLLVDDDEIFNMLNRKLLEKMGIAKNVRTANNGKEAMLLFQQHYVKNDVTPDFIFLDLNMPVMDGFEFLKQFQKMSSHGGSTKVVIVFFVVRSTRYNTGQGMRRGSLHC